MLRALETHLVALVGAALPANVTVVAGPWRPAQGIAVVVHARSLELPPPSEEPQPDDAAFLPVFVEWPANGSTLDFDIPAALQGEVVEVEAPPRVTRALGDAWQLEDRTIRFYRPPQSGNPGVRARLRGSEAKGFMRRGPCRVVLQLSVWAGTMADADTHANVVLQTSLSRLVDLPNLEATRVASSQVWLRIRQARAWLLGIERRYDADAKLFEARVAIQLRGELEQLVAVGVPEPPARIEGLGGTLRVERPDERVDAPEPFRVGGPEPANE